MKIYAADQLTPTNSNARKPEAYTIPPWFFKGRARVGLSGEWSPEYTVKIVGGYVQAASAPVYGTDTGFAVVKNNPFVRNDVVATGLLRGWAYGLVEDELVVTNPMAGGSIVGPYDRLQVVTFSSSGRVAQHGDVTLQLYADVVG